MPTMTECSPRSCVVAAWQSNEDIDDPVLGPIGTDYDILVSRSADFWSVPSTVNTTAPVAIDGLQDHDYDAQVATDGDGISDGAEIEGGTNPLQSQHLQTEGAPLVTWPLALALLAAGLVAVRRIQTAAR